MVAAFSDAAVALRIGHRIVNSLKSYHNLPNDSGAEQLRAVFSEPNKKARHEVQDEAAGSSHMDEIAAPVASLAVDGPVQDDGERALFASDGADVQQFSGMHAHSRYHQHKRF